MGKKRFQIDISGYDGSQANVVKRSFQQRFPTTTLKLDAKTLIGEVEALRDSRNKKGLTRFFIRHLKTTTTEAVSFFRKYEQWYTQTLLNSATGVTDIEVEHIYKLLQTDPTGVKALDKDDNRLFTASQVLSLATPATTVAPAATRRSSPRLAGTPAGAPAPTAAATGAPAPAATPTLVNTTQYTPTKLHTKLIFYQKELYVMLRVNVSEYMDTTGTSVFEGFVKVDDNTRAERDVSLTDENFFDKDKRLPWADIKNFIMKAMCRPPRKGDKVVVFRTTLREDNTILPLWIDDVARMKIDADNEGGAYEEVAKSESMLLATRWVMPAEKELLEKEVQKGSERLTFPSYEDMALKMQLKHFSKYVHAIRPEKLPVNFKQAKSKQALQESLYSYEEVQSRVARATREQASRITFLETRLNEANRRIIHLDKRQRIANRSRQEQHLKALAEVKPVDTKKHPHGLKTKSMYCQKCWDLGLKRRRHAEKDCKPEEQQKGLERLAARK